MTYLKFNVSDVGILRAVQSAQLRLYVSEGGGSANGPGVRRSSNSWSEGGVTWNTRPAHLTALQGDKGAVAGGAWMTFDVTNLVRGDGTVTLAVQPTSPNDTLMVSREGTNKPQLVVNAVPKTINPAVTSVVPAEGAAGVAPRTNVVASFSKKMDKNTLTKANFKLYKVKANGTTTQITNVKVNPSPDGLKATLNPYGTSATLLAKGTKYKAVAATGAQDLDGNPLDQKPGVAGYQQKVWYFKTRS
jgi:hypothetical protein